MSSRTRSAAIGPMPRYHRSSGTSCARPLDTASRRCHSGPAVRLSCSVSPYDALNLLPLAQRFACEQEVLLPGHPDALGEYGRGDLAEFVIELLMAHLVGQ